jgi:hypothetical protein
MTEYDPKEHPRENENWTKIEKNFFKYKRIQVARDQRITQDNVKLLHPFPAGFFRRFFFRRGKYDIIFLVVVVLYASVNIVV